MKNKNKQLILFKGKVPSLFWKPYKTHKCILLACSQFVNVKSGVYDLPQRFTGVTVNKTKFHMTINIALIGRRTENLPFDGASLTSDRASRQC